LLKKRKKLAEMSVIKVNDVNQFSKLISSENVSLVLFYAEWAEQCNQILDILNDLVKKPEINEHIQFLYVPAEDLSEISLKYKIEAVPTVLYFRNNSIIDRIDGVNIALLTSKCKSLIGAAEETKTNLNERLKGLINKSQVMVFMKGDRDAPRCGFSKQLIGILNETKIPYETFDILTDEEVRQGLKKYSDWPTYPQVYVKGELIGGLDIIKELLASDELIATLNG